MESKRLKNTLGDGIDDLSSMMGNMSMFVANANIKESYKGGYLINTLELVDSNVTIRMVIDIVSISYLSLDIMDRSIKDDEEYDIVIDYENSEISFYRDNVRNADEKMIFHYDHNKCFIQDHNINIEMKKSLYAKLIKQMMTCKLKWCYNYIYYYINQCAIRYGNMYSALIDEDGQYIPNSKSFRYKKILYEVDLVFNEIYRKFNFNIKTDFDQNDGKQSDDGMRKDWAMIRDKFCYVEFCEKLLDDIKIITKPMSKIQKRTHDDDID